MMMGDATAGAGFGIHVPVFLHSGEGEIFVGDALVHPFLKFHDLQSGISQRVGVSPQQISIYLAERRIHRSWPRKTPVNAKFDFRTVTWADGAYFLVFLKRPGPRERPGGGAGKRRVPENLTLLRRRGSLPAGYVDPIVDPYEYERRITMALAEMKREATRNLPRDHASANGGGGHVFCEECEKAKDSPPEFHHCPNDAVVPAGTRAASAGPVARPAKR